MTDETDRIFTTTLIVGSIYQLLSVVAGPTVYVLTQTFDPFLMGACVATGLYVTVNKSFSTLFQYVYDERVEALVSLSLLASLFVGLWYWHNGNSFAFGYAISLSIPYITDILALSISYQSSTGDEEGEWKFDEEEFDA